MFHEAKQRDHGAMRVGAAASVVLTPTYAGGRLTWVSGTRATTVEYECVPAECRR